MKFKMVHENYNVTDLDRSLAFYEQALGLKEKRRKVAEDGSFIIVYLGNEESDFELELTWLKDHPEPYDLGKRNFIWRSRQMILNRHTHCMKRWAAFALKIPPWGSILLRTRMDTGWK